MIIRFISQASVVIKTSDCTIWTDPWLHGKAFNDSWALFPEPTNYDDLYDIVDYLWVSHEHPDHFHTATLKSMPEHFKKRVTILFQKNNSDKMPNAFKKLGFEKIILLGNRKKYPLTDKTTVSCTQIGQMDSSLAVIDGSDVVLNVNDCELSKKDYRNFLSDLGQVNVLINQFSIAGFDGDLNYNRSLPGKVKTKKAEFITDHKSLRAKVSVPFASNIYFCCEDNKFINEYAITPADVLERCNAEGISCKLLYPGDELDSLNPDLENAIALKKYEELYKKRNNLQYDQPKLMEYSDLVEVWDAFLGRLRKNYPKWIVKILGKVSVYVPDINITIIFSAADGTFVQSPFSKDEADLIVNSQPLHFALKYPWGIQTLGVSGRYFVRNNKIWLRYRIVSSLQNAEIYLKTSLFFTAKNFRFFTSRMSGAYSQFRHRLLKQDG